MTEQILQIFDQIAFDHCGQVDADTLKAIPEVRDMCNSDKCHAFNQTWTCPPACGTIDECNVRMHRYKSGMLVQTTAELEDDFDYETMMDAEATHKEKFEKLCKMLEESGADFLPLGSGGCRICSKCTYPNAPCRFPKRAMSSMEAYGLLVSQVCQDNHLPYYYGKGTITYTAMILFL